MSLFLSDFSLNLPLIEGTFLYSISEPKHCTMKKYAFAFFAFLHFSHLSSAQSLSLVADIYTSGVNSSYPHYLTEFNNQLYFVAGNGTHHKLYATDGTTANTKLIGPTAGNGVVTDLTVYKNQLYFTYDDGINGLELWTSDGTTGGTVLLKDIWTGANASAIPYSSLPKYFTVCNGLLFFQASTAARAEGLWVTDGTSGGTQMLGNQYSNPFGSTQSFIVLQNKIYFTGNAGSGYGMWSSDGSTAGTQVVKSGNIGSSGGSHAVFNSKFYFQSGDNTTGYELWQSDGTSNGTTLVKDIQPGATASDPSNFFTDGKKVYFVANDGTTGRELWVTDGTANGTQLVKDVATGNASSNPQSIVVKDNQTYFFARNGSNEELYKTDGSPAGTVLVTTIPNVVNVPYSYAFAGKIYFVGSFTLDGAGYLYESDGTSEGTKQLNPLITTDASNPSGFNMLGFNASLYLPAVYESQGNELCKLVPTVTSLHTNNKVSALRVFPNPASDKLQVTTTARLTNAQFSIQTIEGVMVSHGEGYTGEAIDISSLPSGVYLLSIQEQEEVWVGKMVKGQGLR